MKTESQVVKLDYGLYFRTLREIRGYTLEKVAKSIPMAFSNLSRIETGAIKINDESIQSLLKFYGIKNIDATNSNIFEELDELTNNFLTLEIPIEFKYDGIINLNDVNLPYNLLIESLQKVLCGRFDSQLDKIIRILDKVVDLFQEKYVQLYLVFRSYIFIHQKKYLEAQKKLKNLECIEFIDERIQAVYLYYRIALSSVLNNDHESQQYYDKIKNILKNHHLFYRLTKVNLLEANRFSELGYFDEAIKIYEENFENIKENSVKHTVLFNIANQYLFKKEYENALEFYIRSTQYQIDNHVCFSIAWCYYKLNNTTYAKIYIDKSKEYEVYTEYYVLFLQWLECMLHKKYSKKCFEILKKIEKRYIKIMHQGSMIFLYMQLEDYYLYHEMYKEAHHYSRLINESHIKY